MTASTNGHPAPWVRRYELRFPLLDRAVRPFHFAITLSTATIALVNIIGAGLVFGGSNGVLPGIGAGIAAVMLLIGWAANWDRLTEWGLLGASGIWAARAAYSLLAGIPESWAAFLLSMAWSLGALGAYLLERADDETR